MNFSRIIARLHSDAEVQAHLTTLFGVFGMMSDNEFAWNWDVLAAVFFPVGTVDFVRVRDHMKGFMAHHTHGMYNGFLLNVMSMDKNPMTAEYFPYVNYIYRQQHSTLTASISSTFLSTESRREFYHSVRADTVDPDLYYLLGGVATIQLLSLSQIPCYREKSMFDMDVIFLGRVMEKFSTAPEIPPLDTPTTFVKYSSPFEPLLVHTCPSMEAERVFYKFMFAAFQVVMTHSRFVPQVTQTTRWLRFCFSHRTVRLTPTTIPSSTTTTWTNPMGRSSSAGPATGPATGPTTASF
jgi:hypothetical protein